MKKKILYSLALVLVIVIMFVSTYLFTETYRSLRRSGAFQQPTHSFYRASNSRQNNGSPAIGVSSIKRWMTFEYINSVFNLPGDYLKNELGVTNAKYPKLTIYHEARIEQIPETTYLERVKDAVSRHIASTTPQ